MSEPRELVEHFFRHEFGRLVAVLLSGIQGRVASGTMNGKWARDY